MPTRAHAVTMPTGYWLTLRAGSPQVDRFVDGCFNGDEFVIQVEVWSVPGGNNRFLGQYWCGVEICCDWRRLGIHLAPSPNFSSHSYFSSNYNSHAHASVHVRTAFSLHSSSALSRLVVSCLARPRSLGRRAVPSCPSANRAAGTLSRRGGLRWW